MRTPNAIAVPFRLQGLKGSPTGEYYVCLGLHSWASVFESRTPRGRLRAEGEVPTTPVRLEPTRAEAAAMDRTARTRSGGSRREHPESGQL